ncbi:hypothetical protein PM082_024139 [Marasmius tenuissimus]|nr:hypothetical protein PM082_024139 [Marasmius tenuissimus]
MHRTLTRRFLEYPARTLQASAVIHFKQLLGLTNAELSSENEYDDDGDEQSITQDDNDDTTQNGGHSALPPQLFPSNEPDLDVLMTTFSDNELPESSVKGEVLVPDTTDTQHQIMQILHRTDPQFLHPHRTRPSIPTSASDRYAHFSRPTQVLHPEPALPYSFSATTKPGETVKKRKVAPCESQSRLVRLLGCFEKKKTLEEVSASAAPFGTFFVKERPQSMKRMWSKWAAGHPVAPDNSIPRRELAPGEWVKVRTPPRLFRSEDFGKEVERESDHTFRFRRKTFNYGLLIKFFRELSLTTTRILPPDLAGDKVTLLEDGRIGTIEEVSCGTCVVDFGNNEKHPCTAENLQKVVVPGDSIQVVAGEHVGKEGLVFEKHGSILNILARNNERSRINLFVHINSVKVHRLSFDPHDDMPWLNLKVVIMHGRYREMRAVVKAARLTALRDRLMLLLYITELACLVEVNRDDVVKAVTRKPLMEYQPLEPSQNARFKVDDIMVKMCTGRVPWVGMRVHVSGGAHKGKEGVVRDMNHSTWQSSDSGLDVSVELEVISPNMSNRVEKVDYAHVREIDSGLELARSMPLTRDQDFYKPRDSKKAGEQRAPWRGVRITQNPYISSSGVTPKHISQYEDLDWDNVGDPWNPHSLLPSAWLAPSFISPTSSPTSPDHPPCPPSLTPTPSPRPRRLPPSQPSHWIFHPALLEIPIHVTIKGGKWKRKTAFVTPTSSEHDTTIVFRHKEDAHPVDCLLVAKHSDRPKPNSEQSLMVVTGGDEQHIGKFVRRIMYFYNETKSDDSQWFIAGVVDRTGRQDCLTGELLELPPTDLDIVEESKGDRNAGNTLFEGL